MTTLRIYLQNDRAGEKFVTNRQRDKRTVLLAMRNTATLARDEILERGRADIAASGRYGQRWTEGLEGTVTEGGGNIRVSITHRIPIFSFLLKGGTIRGHPTLWIPFTGVRAGGIGPRDFPGKLFIVNMKKGLTILMSAADQRPKFFAKTSVTIQRKFNTDRIIQDVARRLRLIYRKEFADNKTK